MKNKINILATFKIDEEDQAKIRGISDRIDLKVMPVRNVEEIPNEQWEVINVLLTQGVLPQLENVPNLKWVQLRYVGIDAILDHPIFGCDDIAITTMSGAITRQIAEFVMMAILSMGKNLLKIISNQREKHWPIGKERLSAFVPVDLRNSTVGIVGYGSIGRQVARLLQPFQATVLASKKDVLNPEDDGYTPEGVGDQHGDFFTRLYPSEALKSMLAESDFVVVALPLTDSTQNIIDAEALAAMKPTAYLINVGRGELIDEGALINALQENQIAGAVLDVFVDEPLPEDNPLWDMPNVIVSPHISWLSRYFKSDTLALFIENLNRLLENHPLYNRVDPKRKY